MLWMAAKIVLALFPEEHQLIRLLSNQANDNDMKVGSNIPHNCTRLEEGARLCRLY
jgi:hypothetical protein